MPTETPHPPVSPRPARSACRFAAVVAGLAALSGLAAAVPSRATPVVEERSVAQLADDMAAGRTTSEALVRAYLHRIDDLDRHGPALHSVIALNPHALDDARRLDSEREAGRIRGPLHGVPVLIKDNIEDSSGLPTTAGSLALADNVTNRDAPVVARLKAAGAVILGKTNLSEWANIRSSRSISGWSAVGGLVRNPYALDRNACGSSSGTGAAVAASFAAVGVGTETDGSVTCPSAINGLVGLKPTVGLVSRTHIVPISHSQDTAGPMGRSVADVAALLTAMAGPDPADAATARAPVLAHPTDYTTGLQGASLRGVRVGVLRYASDVQPDEAALFEAALATLRAQGAAVVEIKGFKPAGAVGEQELTVLMTELKADLNTYLATTDPARVKTRTLADVIAFDRSTPREMALFGQDEFETAQATGGLSDPAYLKARADSLRASAADGIDKLLAADRLDVLVAPTTGPSWRTDVADGDHVEGEGATSLAAVAGDPHLTVPMGLVKGLPVGISFIGPAWSEAKLLAVGSAYEAATHARRPPRYLPSLETTEEIAPLLAPVR